jgi:hypothetical protein
LSEHLSRKELKQDKIRDTIEHGAEAVYSHQQVFWTAILTVVAVAVAYGGWTLYSDHRAAGASAALDSALRAYSGRIGAPDPADPGEPAYPNEAARSQDALQKFQAVANQYSSTNPGKLAHYYSALCLENLDRANQAQEELKKISSGSDKELANMALYQSALIYARTGKPDEAEKAFRSLADKPSVFVPRPLALIELAGVLRQNKPTEAVTVYQQVKKEYPDSAVSEEADRGLETVSPKS